MSEFVCASTFHSMNHVLCQVSDCHGYAVATTILCIACTQLEVLAALV